MTAINNVDRTMSDEREDRSMVHVHSFNSLSFVHDDHQHIVMGVTAPARLAGGSHVHRIRVRTSYFVGASGHWHWFDVVTGPAICTMDGGHVHTYEGPTSVDNGHDHGIADATTQAPDFEISDVDEMSPDYSKSKKKTLKRDSGQ
ncbi:MAG: YmaF [Firmicutes bacterium]|nr:YmaF [Bacillota bacterium]